jgi:sarcosine oxidase subunit gamma
VLAEATIASAWNVQGDMRRAGLAAEAQRLFGLALPVAANNVAKSDTLTALWLGPASWLVISRGASSLPGYDPARDALTAAGGALFDVTASRIAWRVAGPEARSVLAKSCPLDFHRRAFPPQTCAQSLFGHVNALFVNNGDDFSLMVGRSFARDVWRALCLSAAQYGCEVKAPAAY